MVIWKDVGVVINEKQVHIRKIGGRLFNSFIKTYGDIPVVIFGDAGKVIDVVNTRGRAYAARRRKAFRKGAFIAKKNAAI